MKIKIIILNLGIFYISCTKEFTNELKYVKEPVIVIDAFINDIKLPSINYYSSSIIRNNILENFKLTIPSIYEKMDSYVKIRLSNSLFTSAGDDTILITKAIVILKDEENNMDTLRESSDPLFIPNNNRFNPKGVFRLQKIKPIAGKSYTLDVIYNNIKYTAKTYIPTCPKYDSVNIFYLPRGKTNLIGNNIESNSYQPILYLNNNYQSNYLIFKRDYLPISNSNSYNNSYNTNVIEISNSNSKIEIDGFYVEYSNKYSGTRYPREKFYSNGIQDYYIFDSKLLIEIFKKTFESLESVQNNLTELYYGSISKESYTYFDNLKKLFINDNGNYKPTPNTPKSNFNNGALGYFYGSSGYTLYIFQSKLESSVDLDPTIKSKLKLVTFMNDGSHYFTKEANFNKFHINYLPPFK